LIGLECERGASHHHDGFVARMFGVIDVCLSACLIASGRGEVVGTVGRVVSDEETSALKTAFIVVKELALRISELRTLLFTTSTTRSRLGVRGGVVEMMGGLREDIVATADLTGVFGDSFEFLPLSS
jgi:hypothetical protein